MFSLSFTASRARDAHRIVALTTLLSAPLLAAPAAPEETTKLDDFKVVGRAVDLVGTATSASQGSVGYVELESRPFLRRGELLEVIPGVVITQHSGSGKANQYYLRGFNLDHGTDLSVQVDDMPVNLPTNAHGQGYADINFLIPEFVQSVDFNKGPFYPEIGDFSAAGAAHYRLFDELPRNFVALSAGENGYARFAAGDSLRRGTDVTTLGIELEHYDGPWETPDNFHRLNALVRQTWNRGGAHFSVTALGYRAKWTSTDQIPLRAVESGALDRFGTLDPSDGGETTRSSLSFLWRRGDDKDGLKLSGYVIDYHLDLFSNFTYFLDDPVHGDQFNQSEDRVIVGGMLRQSWTGTAGGRPFEATVGLQTRADFLDVGLFHTERRARLDPVRDDRVREANVGLFGQSVWRLSDRLRLEAGGRFDLYGFDVRSDNTRNSGKASDTIVSPKVGVIFNTTTKTEIYANAGFGFHSNDARGTTIKVDPKTGDPADAVPPLVRSKGIEAGVRTSAVPGLVSTLSLWALDLDSELVFVGDAGGTEASGATRRYGVEWANYYKLRPWLVLDCDVALTHARYKDAAPDDRVENSVGTVITAGLSVTNYENWFGSARLRYFGHQPFTADGNVTAPASATINLQVGRSFGAWQLTLDCLNVLDRENFDIGYFYTSRLRGEPAVGVDDVHFHPAEPRAFRLSLTRHF